MINQKPQRRPPHTISSGVPRVKAQAQETTSDIGKIGNWIMAACCLFMIAGAGMLLLGMGAGAGWTAQLAALAPIGICLGAHIVMHKIMGRSCHGHQTHKGQDTK